MNITLLDGKGAPYHPINLPELNCARQNVQLYQTTVKRRMIFLSFTRKLDRWVLFQIIANQWDH